MTDLPGFPDLEQAVCDLLEDLGETGIVTPADLQDRLPFHRVQRFGGADDVITDTAALSVDTFAADAATGRERAEQVRQRLLSGPHATAHGVIDLAETTSAPVEVPWDGAPVRRWTATYRLQARR